MQYKTIKRRGENKHNPRREKVELLSLDGFFLLLFHFEMKNDRDDNESQ